MHPTPRPTRSALWRSIGTACILLAAACRSGETPATSGNAAATELKLIDSAPVPAEFMETESAITLLPGGTAVLFDNGTKAIYCLDVRAKTVLCRFGRGGSGPGEFGSVTAQLVDSTGRIAVADVMLRRLTVLSKANQLQTTVPLNAVPGSILRFSGDTVVIAWINGFTPEIGVVDLSRGTATVLAKPFEADSGLAVLEPGMMGPSPFLAFASRTNGSVLVASPSRYRIVSITPAGVAQEWGGRPELTPSMRTEEEIEELVRQSEKMFAAMPAASRPSKEKLREQYTRPKPFFGFFGLVGDQADRLWVITTRGVGDSTVVDLFGSDGKFQRSFTFPHRIRSLSVMQNRLAYFSSTETETDELKQVHLYQITGP